LRQRPHSNPADIIRSWQSRNRPAHRHQAKLGSFVLPVQPSAAFCYRRGVRQIRCRRRPYVRSAKFRLGKEKAPPKRGLSMYVVSLSEVEPNFIRPYFAGTAAAHCRPDRPEAKQHHRPSRGLRNGRSWIERRITAVREQATRKVVHDNLVGCSCGDWDTADAECLVQAIGRLSCSSPVYQNRDQVRVIRRERNVSASRQRPTADPVLRNDKLENVLKCCVGLRCAIVSNAGTDRT
jgi:hypothetical protein